VAAVAVADNRFDFLLLLGVVEALPPLVVLLPLRTGSTLFILALALPSVSFAAAEADDREAV
jgi:hypothetical protein